MLRLTDHVRTAHTTDGALLLDIERGRMFALNPIASRIVELLKPGADEKQIASQLVRECAIDLKTAETDTVEFLTLLRQQSLVQSCAR